VCSIEEPDKLHAVAKSEEVGSVEEQVKLYAAVLQPSEVYSSESAVSVFGAEPGASFPGLNMNGHRCATRQIARKFIVTVDLVA